MIPRTAAAWQGETWQQQLAAAFDSPAALLRHLGIDPARMPQPGRAADGFRLRVPRAFADLMTPGDPDDPLLRQVWPSAEELAEQPGFVADPVGDGAARRRPGLLQKYRGRALLMTTGACAVNCRYCFRRHYPYGDDAHALDGALEALAGDDSIAEVILSGGDPLALGDERLGELVRRLDRIPHLHTLRLHTRVPVVLPDRLTPALTGLLRQSRLQPVLVLHANHPRELSDSLARRLAPLPGAGITLLNQSVLLRGVNDDATTLAELSWRLFRAGVLPYYLHLLDPVLGAAHFQLPQEQAVAIHQRLRERLPGYLVPRLVQELPGMGSKTPVS